MGKTNLGFETTDHMPVRRGFTSHVGFLYGMEDYHWGQIGCAYRGAGCEPGLDITDKNGTYEASRAGVAVLGPPGRPPTECEPERGQPVPKHCIPNRGIGMDAHTTAMYFTHDFWFNDAPAPQLAREVYYSTNWYTEYTLSLLRNHSAADAAKIWIHLCYQAVHGPFEEVPLWEQLDPAYTRGGDRVYGDMLAVMDTGLSNITRQLKGPGNQWAETLIVVTSDNGGPTTSTGPNNYPLRGSKESPWDGGTRVACMVSGGFIEPRLRGTVSHGFMSVADWYATLCTLVGVDPSDVFDGHEVDSLDMWPLITQANTTNPREFLPVTEQTLIWKGRFKYMSQSWALGFDGWSTPNNTMIAPPPMSDARGGTFCTRCLFDIVNDEQERVNIAADYPDIVDKLEAQLATYQYIVGPNMTAEQLRDYDCTPPPLTPEERTGWPSQWPWTSRPEHMPPAAPPPPPVASQPVHFGADAKGPGVRLSSDFKQATWPSSTVCNEVALIEPTPGGLPRFWVAFAETQAREQPIYLDVGFCSRTIALNLSGSAAPNWMGDQVSDMGKPLAWIYRAHEGLFRIAQRTHDPGNKYGRSFGAGNNVTVTRHSATKIEFSVDGVSQGLIVLPAGQSLPADVVGCVGACVAGVTATLGNLPAPPAQPLLDVFAGPCCRRKS